MHQSHKVIIRWALATLVFLGPASAVAQTVRQQQFQLPTWPQNWAVNNREPAGIAFAVTQPGLVTVQVQSQGAPVAVALFGAAPQPVQQQSGAGMIQFQYQVTPADVQRSALWRVRIGLAQPGGPPAQAVGTVAVQHPPADVNAVRAETQARAAQRLGADPQAEARMKAAADAAFQAEVAQFQKIQAARRASVVAELQPHLQAARARTQRGIGTRGVDSADDAKNPSATTADADVATRGGFDGQPRMVAEGSARFPTLTAILPPPSVTWFSRTHVQPGDPLLMTGTAFGERTQASKVTFTLLGDPPRGGEVAFVAPVQEWNDGLILISVPDISGIISGRQATITVTRGSDGAANVPQGGLIFAPAIELRQLPLPPPFGESAVHSPLNAEEDLYSPFNTGYASNPSVPPGWFQDKLKGTWSVKISRAGWLGDKGNDSFFPNKRLRNGWTVAKAEVLSPPYVWCWWSPNSGGAYVAESRVGTNMPYLNVRVWLEPYCHISYAPSIWIQGPKGVPYE